MANVMPKIRLEGMDHLIKRLNKLENRAKNTVARKALRAGTTPILKAARQNLRGVLSKQTRGQLVRSLTRVIRTYRNTGKTVAVVGPSWPEGAHGHLIEFGTGPRYHKKTGKYVGFVSPMPFLRPAFDMHQRGAMEKIRTVLEQELIGKA